jgi:hypothetical protein
MEHLSGQNQPIVLAALNRGAFCHYPRLGAIFMLTPCRANAADQIEARPVHGEFVSNLIDVQVE